ncbi:hypothetical protein [Streptomyces natalensis]|uniref:Uncharacterized protein n=1 Tax=Streptomyces natalensis ATCC 27448 TaxID=1240678 RepID=A0A0D7CS22_9ACTN|nr:hypothetical protein [Streptomyces natalensis]KIZ19049.1 hypothetical protein SNA_04845 [Streptomyces natalensis ATCC 27448]
MTNLISRTRNRLQALFVPQGHHRAKSPARPPRPVRPASPARSAAASCTRRPGPYAADVPIDGDATAMVRPYLLPFTVEAAR